MGYSEVVCHLCGVTFSIGRHRSLKEFQNPDPDCPDIDAALLAVYLSNAGEGLDACEAKEGCMVAVPARKLPKDDGSGGDGDEKDDTDMKDTDSDTDYVDRPGKETEPYEFDTPDEDTPERDSDVEMTDADGSSDGSDEEPLWRRELEPASRGKKLIPYAEWKAMEEAKWKADGEASGEDDDEHENSEDGSEKDDDDDKESDKDDNEHHESEEEEDDDDDEKKSDKDESDDEDPSNDEDNDDDENEEDADDGDQEQEEEEATEDLEDINTFVEHIPGPNCTSEGGYRGSRISLAEMRGCTIVQVLAPKPEDWTPSDDDEPFERDPDFGFFLTGLCDLMPSRDSNYPTVFPARHGLDDVPADNCVWVEENADDMGMPFHPTCFEVFKRASLRRNGEVDLRGLMAWFRLEAAFDLFEEIPRSAAVGRGGGQWWCHTKGDEHIVANPCYVPKWDEMLSSSMKAGASDIVYGPDDGNVASTTTDRFTSLPQNVRQRILFHLVPEPQAIANLRLSSRAFRQLHQSLFRDLLLHNRPWIWEAWCSMPYSFWTTTSSAMLKKQDKAHRQRLGALENAISVLREEAYAGNNNASAIQTLEAQIDSEKRVTREDVPVAQLQQDGTDWHALYLEIRKPKPKWPKGLRNRRRIWRDCEHILDRIERNKREGKIGPGITVNPVQTMTDYYERASRDYT